jgi:LEA14-like dessication related protein
MGKITAKTGTKSNIAIWIAGGVVAIGGFLMFARTNANKLLNMADFKLTDVRVMNVKVLSTAIRASVTISNPSALAVNLTALRVEFLRLADGEKKVLATSPTTKLVIPKSGNINYNINFDISNIQVMQMVSGAIQTGIESQFKGKISIRIKCEVAGQYIEKEIPYL